MLFSVTAAYRAGVDRRTARTASASAWLSTAERLGVRPLSARSVVLSTLLGSHPPTRTGPALIAVGGLFGIPAGTVRVALSRLVADGELVAHDGSYDLAASFARRQLALDAGRHVRRGAWDGSWWVVVALSERRALADRRAFRTTMTTALFGELRPDVWLRPSNIPAPPLDDDVMLARAERAHDESTVMAARLWDLPARRAELRRLCDEADRAMALVSTEDRGVLAETFTISVAITRALAAEPQLPDELVGADWPADELRRRYAALARQHGQALGAAMESIHD